jgi:hypothetical protein
MVFSEVGNSIGAYIENITKPINTLYGKGLQLMFIKGHCAMRNMVVQWPIYSHASTLI